MLRIATKTGLRVNYLMYKQTILITPCYKLLQKSDFSSMIDEQIYKQTNERTNVVLRIATKIGVRINDLITKQTML